MGHRMWLPAVAIHRLRVLEIAPSHHHCFRTAHPCTQSVKGSPIEPVLSRSRCQRLCHPHSHFDGGWHVCQAIFPQPQSAAACRQVERRDCAHAALPRIKYVGDGIHCKCGLAMAKSLSGMLVRMSPGPR